jgi:endonuclease/exonuclease/phosphatase (EEP) superfamily protein YafD
MSSFTVRCACGEHFHTDAASVGRSVRCRCGRIVKLRSPRISVIATTVSRVLTVLAWSYLVAIAAVALVMWGLGDQWWPATILVFMGRWVFLLPLAVLAPAAMALRPRLLLPLALGAVVALGPVMGGRVGWARPFAPSTGMPLRVVTLNADVGQLVAREFPRLIQQWAPDVVLLQECGEELASATERMPGWQWHHEGGLCMLTRFPIVAAEVMDRSALARVRQDQSGIGGAGYVVRYTLRTPGGMVNVTNLHLETPRKGFEGLMAGNVEQLRLNTTLRDVESTLARRWVDAARGPTIVAGDFNTPVESRIFQEHWGDLADAFSRTGIGLGMTKYNGWIRIRIDHVLTNDALRPVRARVWTDVGSDHRPLIADLMLRGT